MVIIETEHDFAELIRRLHAENFKTEGGEEASKADNKENAIKEIVNFLGEEKAAPLFKAHIDYRTVGRFLNGRKVKQDNIRKIASICIHLSEESGHFLKDDVSSQLLGLFYGRKLPTREGLTKTLKALTADEKPARMNVKAFAEFARGLYRKRFESDGRVGTDGTDALKEILAFFGNNKGMFEPDISTRNIGHIIGESGRGKFRTPHKDAVARICCEKAKEMGYVVEKDTYDLLRSLLYGKRVGEMKKTRIGNVGEIVDSFYDKRHSNPEEKSSPGEFLERLLIFTRGAGRENKIEQLDLANESGVNQAKISHYVSYKDDGKTPDILHRCLKSFFNLYKRIHLNTFLKEAGKEVPRTKLKEAFEGSATEALEGILDKEELEKVARLDLTDLQKRKVRAIAYNITLEKEYATTEDIINNALDKEEDITKLPEKLIKEDISIPFSKRSIGKQVGDMKIFQNIESGVTKNKEKIFNLIKTCCEARTQRAIEFELGCIVPRKIPDIVSEQAATGDIKNALEKARINITPEQLKMVEAIKSKGTFSEINKIKIDTMLTDKAFSYRARKLAKSESPKIREGR